MAVEDGSWHITLSKYHLKFRNDPHIDADYTCNEYGTHDSYPDEIVYTD